MSPFSIPDIINSTFEAFGAIFVLNHARTLLKDKVVRGVSLASIVFFFCWGLFNIFYYKHLEQHFSWTAGLFVTLANLVWIVLILHYRKKEKQSKLEAMTQNKFRCVDASGFGNFQIDWGSNKGFGQLVFYYDDQRNKMVCHNEFIPKEWVVEIISKFAENLELTDFYVGDDVGESKKSVRELQFDEASQVFSKIVNKKMLRFYTNINKSAEHTEIEDRFDGGQGQVYVMFSTPEHNTTLDEAYRALDIDFTKLSSNGEDKIQTITGFSRIEEWTWKDVKDENRFQAQG